MTTLRLLLGDCVERMALLPEGSVDAIICDPPYGIFFMSRAWDEADNIAFSQRFWTAAMRVLAPGGTVKAFSGSRTFHRMAAAMEEAGFVDVDVVGWGYGCLSADTEILTESGWRAGADVSVGDRVACWDPTTGQIVLDAVQETFFGPFKGNLVSFKNDNTDQLLTPNHRVWKKHRIRKMVGGKREEEEESEWNVQEAGEIDRWNNIRLPLAGVHDGPGIGGTDLAELLGWVWAEGGFDRKGTGVRISQSSVNQPHVDAIQALLDELVPTHNHYTRERKHTSRDPVRDAYRYTEHTWYFSGEVALLVRELLPDKHPTWGLIWRMTQEEKKAFMWAAVRGDGQIKRGAQRRGGDGHYPDSYCFYQQNEQDLEMFQGLCHLTGRQGHIAPNNHRVGVEARSTTQFQSRHLKSSVPVAYDGDVWCVRVLTGAFVARRNGLIFITGNSGFPKSLDVSKAIDKSKGLERKVVGTKRGVRGADGTGHETAMPGKAVGVKQVACDVPVTAPASPEAEAWGGWGTALKPAWEPVIVGRKP